MLNRQKTRDREAMLKRIGELDAEIAQHERNLREGEARLPIEEQLRLKLRRFVETNFPELAGKVRVEKHRWGPLKVSLCVRTCRISSARRAN
jgi:hypothetical protein